jgi:predicted DCC family thiol-disulfide oxidoreductase YuxK
MNLCFSSTFAILLVVAMMLSSVSAFTRAIPTRAISKLSQRTFATKPIAAISERQMLYASNELSNIILFDGVCNFCNKWVDIMLQLDTGKKFKFCALQSPKGKELLLEIGKNADDISTVVLIKSLGKKEAYFKSDAVLKVVEQLGLPLMAASAVGSTIPLFIRNGLYNEVAANRYNFLGKRELCRCADPEYMDRFI